MNNFLTNPERDRLLEKIGKCQQRQGVVTCFACRAYMDCETAKAHLREERELAFQAGVEAGQRRARLAKDLQLVIEEVEDSSGKPNT